jgi:predicted HNH restriction endonuclease
MSYFLLTWNPKKWPWASFEKDLATFRRKGYLDEPWSCGSQGGIKPGDRVFLLKQGPEQPKGIFASGHATSTVYADLHWAPEKAALRKLANYIKVRFDHLLDYDEQIIPTPELREDRRFSDMYWDTQTSGIRIQDDVAAQLEIEWSQLIGTTPMAVEFEPEAIEGIVTETLTYRHSRDNRLRQQALDKSKGICQVCGVNFGKIWNGKGLRVLHVHHKKQLAVHNKPRLTKLSDLAVVCANCHMLIHHNPTKAISVESLRKILGN